MVARYVITTLTTDRLTLRASKATHDKMCGIAGRPSFTLSMAPKEAYELSNLEYARPAFRCFKIFATVKFVSSLWTSVSKGLERYP